MRRAPSETRCTRATRFARRLACLLALLAIAAPAARPEPEPDGGPESAPASTTGLAVSRTSGSEVSETSESADSETAEPEDGPVYTIDRFVPAYREANAEQPAIESLLPVRARLLDTPSGYVAPRPNAPGEPVRIGIEAQRPARYHASAVAEIARALLERLHERGLLGVYVVPSPEDIDAKSERDLRAAGNQTLHFAIWIGRIAQVRSVAVGKRIRGAWRVDNPAHRHIREHSPLQPAAEGREGTSDLLLRDRLEDYLFRLNRIPGRRVEAALAAAEDGRGVTLDYRVYETRPWLVYAQSSNTGTPRTNPWQTRLGYIHRQLTDRDDELSIEYLNSGFNDVNGVSIAYRAPWFDGSRPRWMKRSGSEPRWLAWANRDKIPWWGSDRLRWELLGGWTRVDAGAVGKLPGAFNAVDEILSQDWHLGSRFVYNVWQHHDLFLDAVAGARFRGVSVDNKVLANKGDAVLLLTELGLEAERVSEYATLHAHFDAERGAPLGRVDEYERDFEQLLGRRASDRRWWALHWNIGLSAYLEPLFNRRAWRNPSTPGSSTLSHEVAIGLRGQYGFDYRLLPQVSQVIGGLYSVRGFPEGVAVGDSVYIGSFEYRFHLPRALSIRREPLQLPLIGDFRVAPQQVYGRPDWDLVLRAFVDAGHTIRNQREGTREANQTLVGAGVGLELSLGGRARARVDWARGVFQKTQCQPGVCSAAQLEDNIDPQGEFHFLFSLMY